VAVKTSVARRYARALLMIAREQSRINETKQELIRVVGFFDRVPDLFAQLLSPALGKQERGKILRQLIPALGLSPDTGNFILLLNQKARLEYLKKIYEAYLLLSDEASGIKRAQVYSAHPLPEDSRRRLIRALEKRTGKTVVAEFRIDRELIGGVKVQIGSLLLDGSVRAQLKLMAEKLRRI